MGEAGCREKVAAPLLSSRSHVAGPGHPEQWGNIILLIVYHPANCVLECVPGPRSQRGLMCIYKDVRGVHLSNLMLHYEQTTAAASSFLLFQAAEASLVGNNTMVIVFR